MVDIGEGNPPPATRTALRQPSTMSNGHPPQEGINGGLVEERFMDLGERIIHGGVSLNKDIVESYAVDGKAFYGDLVEKGKQFLGGGNGQAGSIARLRHSLFESATSSSDGMAALCRDLANEAKVEMRAAQNNPAGGVDPKVLEARAVELEALAKLYADESKTETS
ncbi:hypothetical protein A3C23_03335 [Candidatus Roizmanbacteria bacterium RIFCSPHIGHO2_02_FULL_37_13b]|uniref:Uncharacterized protein n=1 Tax=Candidatus Roizmanbacteria bacterium RIFCSPLOWO2_02_FULL_36_11 TaxID=1802071 RepID=A0A1F7JGG3_9BACT|nr:MAG: hypothetical protein A3C23_03335 [Candidatus Roizmanbacteria bacterium RIFCSPHIGHO2_02_FULL_37_13b]OGK54710.1 MAG: hypothetical protein A3H78_05445 [Candidatus Roizmanbacteria bacterium RIFCSPLOWO2_02_FULL_36_11]